jgi:hypothetical protein
MDQFESKEVDVVNSLDESIKNLLNHCNEIQDMWVSKRKDQPFWSVCVNKFQTSYIKVNNSDCFIDIFRLFHNTYGRLYSVPIFEEEDVNDGFFKDKKVFQAPGDSKKEKKTVAKSSWKTKPKFKGPVIYFSMENEKTSSVCIAIGEIYEACLILYEDMLKNGEDNSNIRVLPSKFLYYFYSVIFFSFEEEKNFKDKKVIQSNLVLLKEFINDITSDENESSSSSSPFGIIKDIIKKITGSNSNILPSGNKDSLNKVMDGLSSGNGMEHIQNAFANVMSSVTESGIDGKEQDIGEVLGSIAKGLTSPSTIASITSIQKQISTLTGDGELAPPTQVDNTGSEAQD